MEDTLVETKRCSTCKVVKPCEAGFSRAKGGRSRCKDCCRLRANARYAQRKLEPGFLELQCKKQAMRRAGYRNPRPDGFGPEAKEHYNAWRREQARWLRYGVTPEEYNRRFAEQEGACAICRQKQDEVLRVDHCHQTQAIRGLLCDDCNKGVGAFGDGRPGTVERMQAAIRYLTS